MGKTNSSTKSDALDFTDLNGSISNAIIFPDSHFGLESEVWANGQRIADMLPVSFKTFGDLTEEDVDAAIEKAKGAELQVKKWGETSSAISRYIKALIKVRETQAKVNEDIAEARVSIAQIEKELKTNLAASELEYRKIVGGSRSAIATVQDDLQISLNRIANQYTETKAKKQERVTTETTKKEPTAYEEQTTSLVDKFRQLREGRYSGSSFGITQRVKASGSEK
nr:hypothetical protein [Nostoc sp. EkiNYC01]